MKYLKSCLQKGNFLDTSISLISILFINIGLLYWQNLYYWILVSSNVIFFLSIFIHGLYNLQIYSFKTSLYSSSKELSKSLFFTIIVSYNYNKAFFLILQYFFYSQKAFVFHLLRDFCSIHNNTVFFSCSSSERFQYFSHIFFLQKKSINKYLK